MRHQRSTPYSPEYASLEAYREQQEFLKGCRAKKSSWSSLSSQDRKYNACSNAAFASATQEAVQRMTSGEWDNVHPLVFLALYCVWHKKEYGFATTEYDQPKARKTFVHIAVNIIKNQFDGNTSDYAEFVRWTIEKHQNISKWRASHAIEPSRLRAESLTAPRTIADYKHASIRVAQ